MTMFVRVTGLVNGKPRSSDSQEKKISEPIIIKFDVGDYVGDLTPHVCTFAHHGFKHCDFCCFRGITDVTLTGA